MPTRTSPHRPRTAAALLTLALAAAALLLTLVAAPLASAYPAGWSVTTLKAGVHGALDLEYDSAGRAVIAYKSGLIARLDGTVVADLRPDVNDCTRTNPLDPTSGDRGLMSFDIRHKTGTQRADTIYAWYYASRRPAWTGSWSGPLTDIADRCPNRDGQRDDPATNTHARLVEITFPAPGQRVTRTLVEGVFVGSGTHGPGYLEYNERTGKLEFAGGDGGWYRVVDPGVLRAQDPTWRGRYGGGGLWEMDPVPGATPTVRAHGLRNPFRGAINPANGDTCLSDTQWGKDDGPAPNNVEEVNCHRVSQRGGTPENYGWPCYSGRDREGDYGTSTNARVRAVCDRLYAAGTAIPATHQYPHFPRTSPECTESRDGCGSISSVGFIPASFPAPYAGRLVMGDYSQDRLYWVPAGTTTPRILSDQEGPVDIETSPTGGMVIVNIEGGTITEVRAR